MHRSQARLPSEILQPRLTENWPRHKKWHKMQALQQKELAANTASYAHKEQAARATENLLDTSADTDGSGITQKMSEVLNISGLEEEMACFTSLERWRAGERRTACDADTMSGPSGVRENLLFQVLLMGAGSTPFLR